MCSKTGKNALCASSQEDKTLEYRQADKKVLSIADFPDLCTPGMIFKEMCNICVCGLNEIAACTKTNCDLGWSTKTSSLLDDEGRVGKLFCFMFLFSPYRLKFNLRLFSVPIEEIWIQKKRNSRFCRRNPVSLYCRYLRSYRLSWFSTLRLIKYH